MSDIPDDFIQTCFCVESEETLGAWERACIDLAKAGDVSLDKALLDGLFRAAHNLKGSAASVGLDAFKSLVHEAENAITGLRNGTLTARPGVFQVLLEVQSVLMKWTLTLKTDTKHVEPFDSGKIAALWENVPPDGATGSSASNDPNISAPARPSSPKVFPDAPAEDPRTKSPRNAPCPQANADQVLRVSSRRIDALLSLVGEISTKQSAINHHLHKETHAPGRDVVLGMHDAQSLLRELYEQVLSLKLQPSRALLQRLERVAADVARSQGKDLDIQVEGGDVEIDKFILERLIDPLIHLVRNAVDHGIEPSEDRTRSGKPERGLLFVSIAQESSGVRVRISDDGRGIDERKVLAKAKALGLVADENTHRSRPEVFALLFEAGFSTAEKITDVSGRGVGLDVVRSSIREMGGELQITSELGSGTSFEIALPASDALIDVLVMRSRGVVFALPVNDVSGIIDLTECTTLQVMGKGEMISSGDGKVMPLKSLDTCMSASADDDAQRSDAQDDASGSPVPPALAVLFTVQHAAQRAPVAFGCDALLGQQRVIAKEPTGLASKLPYVSGTAVIGSGEPVFIVDLNFFCASDANLRVE